ncbi:MAG: aspartate--tRNA(Asn) ligase [bacterium]|nr:aspartate--tRNA(Asn) ligase [bacterium]
MERTLIKELEKYIGKEVTISGWVDVRRDHGKLVFLDIRDRSGKIQVIFPSANTTAGANAKTTRPEWVVTVRGIVKERPENMRKEELNGNIELDGFHVEILAEAEVPFELGSELNLDTYLDHLPYTVRSQKARDVFVIQATIIEAFRASLRRREFVEFQAPALVGGDAEGGAAAFKVDYYYDQQAFLATSPQLYKQIMVGAFERVFTTAKIFRGEKHATTRHLSELVQMDFEMGFIQDHRDIMDALEHTMRDICADVGEKHADIFKRFNLDLPKLPKGKFPTLKLKEAQDLLGVAHEPDLEPEHERHLHEWALREHGSDFVFVTHFPISKRPFYTFEDPDDLGHTRYFDLLFRGLEINSGGQRVHNYDALVERIKQKGLDPAKFAFYLQAFKVGMPPHGGCSTGLERLTARMLELPNIREATLFPRDLNRIDTLLRVDK